MTDYQAIFDKVESTLVRVGSQNVPEETIRKMRAKQAEKQAANHPATAAIQLEISELQKEINKNNLLLGESEQGGAARLANYATKIKEISEKMND